LRILNRLAYPHWETSTLVRARQVLGYHGRRTVNLDVSGELEWVIQIIEG
jgi:hypothetical protein